MRVPLVLLAALALACTDDPAAPRRVPARSAQPASFPSSERPSPSAQARGLGAHGNDPALVDLAKKAKACGWDARGVSEECAAAIAWAAATDGFTAGRADATLVSFLEDADERVRWLAATKLQAIGASFASDRALAERVVTAGERETSARVAPALGALLADVQVEKTNTFDRVRAMAVKHALPQLRAALIANLSRKNPTVSAAFELTRELVRDPDKEVRLAAVGAFYMRGGGRRPEDTCQIWAQNLDNDMDAEVAAVASELLSRWGRCQSAYGALLESQAKRLEEGRTDSPRYAASLGFVCEDKRSQPRERERATDLVHKMADNKALDAEVRAAALDAAIACDPVGGRDFVKKFAEDPPALLKTHAIESPPAAGSLGSPRHAGGEFATAPRRHDATRERSSPLLRGVVASWRRGVPLLLALGCRGNSDATRAPAIEMARCHLPAGRGMEAIVARCGTVEVWEDRAAKSGPKIALHVAVVKATGRRAAPDPIFFLAGGPGQAATETYPLVAASFARMNLSRDVVLVDQRGTGGSGKLACDDVDVDSTTDDPKEIASRSAACRAAIDADLRQYTTANAADNLDEVREALGYQQVNLYGVSYGTRLGLSYLRRHGEKVRAAILDGVVPPGWALGSTSGKDAERAMDLLFARCAADEECHRAFPDPGGSVRALLAARGEPAVVSVPHPVTAASTKVTVTRSTLASTLRALLYTSDTSALLPLLVHQANAENDLSKLAAQSLLFQGATQISAGLHMAVACSEDAPFLDAARAERENAGSFSGGEAARVYVEACAGWPRGAVPAEERAPVSSQVPVLLLSGELDPVTPPSFAEEVGKTLPRSLAVTVPGEGHAVIGRSCVARVATEFLERGETARLDTSCIQQKTPIRFFTSFAGPPP